jgi:hypothetical protein
MINIACVLRQGGKVGYDAEWVAKLKRAVERNTVRKHRFVCLSDCDVACERIPLETGGKGFWAKMQLFRPDLFNGPVLYLDLDTVICNSIDPIIDRIYDQEFVMWHEADKNIDSSAFLWWNKDQSWLWDLYQTQPENHWAEKYALPPLYGDQAFISENARHSTLLDHCPADWFHIASRKDVDQSLESVRLLMFRKVSQKPSTMIDHHLVRTHWL